MNENRELSTLIIILLKNVFYQDRYPHLWSTLLNSQAHIREYVATIGLSLFIDESEGYAFLKQQEFNDEDENDTALPRLISRRPLSYPLSLLCVLLRKKLLERDAQGGEARVILTHEQIVDMMKIFLSHNNNEVKIHDQINTAINKLLELGFLRLLKTDERRYEVCRIIKALVDANWLADLDSKLTEYQAYDAS
jgi:hypothetical protein